VGARKDASVGGLVGTLVVGPMRNREGANVETYERALQLVLQ